MGSSTIFLEQQLEVSVDRLWKALTNKEQLERWFFQVNDFKPEQGFTFSFYTDGEDEKYLHICKILEVVVNRRISFTWRYSDIKGNSIVTYELIDKGNSTLFKLKHEGINTFPQNNSLFSRESFIAGWEELVEISLKEYVEDNDE
jgi:uncharacterized protein YndB with AHSA1/START domain